VDAVSVSIRHNQHLAVSQLIKDVRSLSDRPGRSDARNEPTWVQVLRYEKCVS
jgi:hypothetical protein